MTKLEELKNNILNGTVSDKLIVFKYSDNTFIIHEYINAIAKQHNLSIEFVDTLDSFGQRTQNIFSIVDDNLSVYETDNLESMAEDLTDFNNVIIITKKINDTLESRLKDYIVEVPKLDKWQIEEYTKKKLEGLSVDEREWLCKICNYDIYRLSNECSKISIFTKYEQEDVFKQLNRELGYSDLSNLQIFDLINALLKKDIVTTREVLSSLSVVDVEPAGVVTLLKNQVRTIIDIQSNPKSNYQSLKMSQKQFNAIKYYNCGKIKTDSLIDIYSLLCDIDYKLKSGDLDYKYILDYIVCNMIIRY